MSNKSVVDDGFIMGLAKAIEGAEAKKTVKNDSKIRDVIIVYEVLSKIAKGKNVKVKYALHEPFISSGYVEVNGKNIEIIDPSAFADCGLLAETYECYPKIDGTVTMTFGFNNLMVKGN